MPPQPCYNYWIRNDTCHRIGSICGNAVLAECNLEGEVAALVDLHVPLSINGQPGRPATGPGPFPRLGSSSLLKNSETGQ